MSGPRDEPRARIEDLAALAELADLPAGDPRRRDAESDPRTAAALRAYREFVAPGPLPEGARQDEAEARLLAALERELGVPLGAAATGPEAGSSAATARAERPARPAGPGIVRRFLSVLARPAVRPALATAAVVVVVVAAGALWQLAPREGGDDRVLRGPGATAASGAWAASPTTEKLAGDRVRLSWNAAPGASHYTVVFLAGDLNEIARVTDHVATGLTLAPGSLPAGLESGRDVLWRVLAHAGGDEVGRSDPSPVRVP